MSSLILQTWLRVLKPVMLLFAVFLLLRGHNEPGGGFIGGLLAAAAFLLHAFAYDVDSAMRALRVPPRRLAAAGLLTALASGCISLLAGRPFMTGLWTDLGPLVPGLKLGTPLLFDVGVFLLVLGISLMILFRLMEETYAS